MYTKQFHLKLTSFGKKTVERSSFLVRYLKWEELHPLQLISSGILPGNFLALFLFRLFVTLWLIAMIITGIVLAKWSKGIRWFGPYYSDVQFFFMLGYFLSLVIYHIKFHTGHGRQSRYQSDQNIHPSKGERVLWVLFETLVTNSYFLAFVYWFLVHEGSVGIYAIGAHLINPLLMTIELFMNKLEVVFSHIVFVIVCGALYFIFAWLWHAASKEWIYDYLDFHANHAAFNYVVVIGIGILFFFLTKGLTILRNRWIANAEKRKTFQELKAWENNQGNKGGFAAIDDDEEELL